MGNLASTQRRAQNGRSDTAKGDGTMKSVKWLETLMLRIFLPMVALLALAACASPAGLREGSPVLDETTAKPSERVAGCIGDKLEAQNSALSQIQYSTRPTSNGYSISGDQTSLVLWGGTDTILLIDISNSGNETRVKMYTHFLIGNGPVAWFKLVRGCI
jgi:hypothetical protein